MTNTSYPSLAKYATHSAGLDCAHSVERGAGELDGVEEIVPDASKSKEGRAFSRNNAFESKKA
jgi:hypothetical protein